MNRKADIALIGLAVMGQNLILNMDSHGFVVCAYNRTVDKVSGVCMFSVSYANFGCSRSVDDKSHGFLMFRAQKTIFKTDFVAAQ